MTTGTPATHPANVLSPFAFPERVHLLGVGGAGVSGLGRILVARPSLLPVKAYALLATPRNDYSLS